jgi:glycosyltransferase involved in cell wall biosynthesis
MIKVHYVAGTYEMQAKIITDKTIEALRENDMLVQFSVQPFDIKMLVKCDILHCHSCYSIDLLRHLHTLKEKPLIILQRDSCHAMVQMTLLERELVKAGRDKDEIRSKSFVPDQMEEYKLADGILLASKFEWLSFFVYPPFYKDKLYVVPFTCDAEKYKPTSNREHLKNKSIPFKVAFIGFDAFRKGATYVEQAVQKLKDEGLSIELVSSCPHERLVSMYNNVHVFCLPAVEDGYPMAVLEAMSCAVAPIVSKNTGTIDIIKNGLNGICIPNYADVEDLANWLRYLYVNRDLAIDMGFAARNTIMKYQWPDYKVEIIEMYNKFYKEHTNA